MAQNHEFFWDKRPQSLCKKCGMCCRIATTPKSHEELLQLAAAGDQGAIDFLEIFEPYASIEDAMLVDRAQVERIGYNENTTFYKCRFIQKNNLCSRYDTRKDLCRHCPSTAFVVMPPNCGFNDWLEAERLKIVEKVRALKQEKAGYEKELSADCSENRRVMLNKLIKSIDAYIKNYEKYGANDW